MTPVVCESITLSVFPQLLLIDDFIIRKLEQPCDHIILTMLALRHLPRLPTSQLDISLAILGISQGNINNMEELKNNKVRKLLSKKRVSTLSRFSFYVNLPQFSSFLKSFSQTQVCQKYSDSNHNKRYLNIIFSQIFCSFMTVFHENH